MADDQEVMLRIYKIAGSSEFEKQQFLRSAISGTAKFFRELGTLTLLAGAMGALHRENSSWAIYTFYIGVRTIAALYLFNVLILRLRLQFWENESIGRRFRATLIINVLFWMAIHSFFNSAQRQVVDALSIRTPHNVSEHALPSRFSDSQHDKENAQAKPKPKKVAPFTATTQDEK